ncbi:MAG: SPFH domain-containing protein [Planctomycetota bacterium]|nr:SPFH domain-containing protein [Planctomycetota bacterium]
MQTNDDDPPSGGKPFELRPGGNRPPFNASRLVVAVAGFLILFVMVALGTMGKLGVTSVTAEEVAVKINYISGNRTVITNPGFQIYIPFIEDVFKMDRTPQKFLMAGDRALSTNHVPFLTVRAKDGSNFSFDDLEIQYSILPGPEAAMLLDDSGPGDGFKREWVRAFARSVLRDEFGKYSAVEVADPTVYQAARIASEERLSLMLEEHGLQLIQVICPKPRFDPLYEQAIEDRKEADQEVEKLREEEKRLLNERERKMAGATKEKEIQWQSLQGTLVKDLLNAEQSQIKIQKGADAYVISRDFEAKAVNAQLTQSARGMTATYTKEAEGILARATALEERGEVVVRAALIEKLKNITFTLVPYSRDSEPKRLEHTDLREASASSLSAGRAGGNQ